MRRRLDDGAAIVRVHYTARPDMQKPEDIERERSRFTSQAWWDQEMEIKYGALSGARVYPEFSREIHLIADKDIPRRGCRFMSIDPHPRTPHAMLWVLIDPWNDWYVYREVWPSIVYAEPETLSDDQEDNQFLIKEYAEAIATLEGNELQFKLGGTADEYAMYKQRANGERIVDRYMDQAGKGFIASGEEEAPETFADRYNKYGIVCSDPRKSHQAGEDAVRELLKTRYHSLKEKVWPRLHIAESCRELALEIEDLRYQKTSNPNDERELKQKSRERRRHMCDNLRYLATANIHYSTFQAS